MTLRESLQMQVPCFCRDGVFKFLPWWDKWIGVLGDCVKEMKLQWS